MAGSTFGRNFRVTSWVEDGGNGIGVVVDGVPAGIALSENDVQAYLNRRRPSTECLFSRRHENDFVTINSGLTKGVTNGTPIAMTIINSALKYKAGEEELTEARKGCADSAYEKKSGVLRRVNDRDNASRVAAGAVAAAVLSAAGVELCAYVRSIGSVSIQYSKCSREEIKKSPVAMPDPAATAAAVELLNEKKESGTSEGGVVELIVSGLPEGLGEPVFDGLDARLAAAVISIDQVSGVEFGGGVAGGVSDGEELVLKADFLPTPYIEVRRGEDGSTVYSGEITAVPRSAVVVESMAAVVIADLMLENMHSRIDEVAAFYRK